MGTHRPENRGRSSSQEKRRMEHVELIEGLRAGRIADARLD